MKNKKLLLLLSILSLIVTLFTGCGLPSTSSSTKDNDVSTSVDSSNSESIENTTDEKITLKIVDWSDSSKEYRQAFNEQYMKDHPNIEIEYTVVTIDQFKSSVVSSIKSGDAPDLFPVPVGITLPIAVDENWFYPLTDVIDDAFWDTLNDDILAEGITMIDGIPYTIPNTPPMTSSLMFYNQDVLDKAGITELPKTYSEFIDVCDQITKAGNGDYYGFIEGGKQINRLYALVQAFAATGGARLPDWSDAFLIENRINYDNQASLDAFDLFAQLQKNGSIHPDTVNLTAPEAREYFAQGEAAFIVQGIWCIGVWEKAHPDMNFGTMAIPVPDEGRKGYLDSGAYMSWMGIYSQTKHPKEAGEYLMALYNYSPEGFEYHFQDDFVSEVGQPSIVKGITEANMKNPRVLEYYTLAQQETVSYPNPTIVDTNAYDFFTQVVDVQPSYGSLFQGTLTSGLEDYKTALEILSDAQTEEWIRAIEASGLSVDSFDFTDWDPMNDYQY